MLWSGLISFVHVLGGLIAAASGAYTGFLLRAGNRLFLPAVQVNVTGCFTEIFTDYPTNVRLFKGEITLRLWENIAFPLQLIL